MRDEEIEYSADGVGYLGYLIFDDRLKDPRAGILLAPEGGGLGQVAKDKAAALARLGYVVLAMDYYGGGQQIRDMHVAVSRMQDLMVKPAPVRRIAAAALQALADHPAVDADRLAAIGYCFGGTLALELARAAAPIKAAVGFHSGLLTTEPASAGSIAARILVQIGTDDPLIPREQRHTFEEEMLAAGADWRLIVYGGAGHSFTNPTADALGAPGFGYHTASDERSWRAMIDLLAEVL